MEHVCVLFLNSNINFLNNLILVKRNFVGVSDLESLGPYIKLNEETITKDFWENCNKIEECF
jgi:hypothetical protein